MKGIFTFLLIACYVLASAQATFKKIVFAQGNSYLNQVIQLNDGSYVGTGGLYHNANNIGNNLFLLKADANGNILASKTLVTYSSSVGYSLTKTSDGGVAMCGTSSGGMIFLKFRSDLSIQWQKKYAYEKGFVFANKVLQSSDGGYILGGEVRNNDSSATAMYLLKTDSAGNVTFSKKYSNYGVKHTYDVAITTDGDYALLGLTNDGRNRDARDTVLVVKIKANGSIVWSKYFLNNQMTVFPSALIASSDDGILFAGDTYTLGNSSRLIDQSVMVKYDNAGRLLWSKTIVTKGYSENRLFSAIENKDGSYVFGGEISTFDDVEHTINDTAYGYIVKMNTSGGLQLTKTFAESRDGSPSSFYSIIRTLDGGYLATGEGAFYKTDIQDYKSGVSICKFDSNFLTCGNLPNSDGVDENFGVSTTADTLTTDIAVTASAISVSFSDAGSIENICGSVLPLQLLSFNATLQNKNVNMQWKTASEVNTDHFIIERSNSTTLFTTLQKVVAKGNGNNVETYVATDFQPLPGTSYYRLKSVDKDGSITYSNIVPVTVLANGTVVISPNPVQDNINVLLQSKTTSSATFTVTGITGKTVMTQTSKVNEGTNTISLSAASLSKGMYLLKVVQNQVVQTIKFIKP